MEDGSVPNVQERRHIILANASAEVSSIIGKLQKKSVADSKKEKLIFRLSQLCSSSPAVFGDSPTSLLKGKGVKIPVGKVNEKMVAFLGINHASEVFVFEEK